LKAVTVYGSRGLSQLQNRLQFKILVQRFTAMRVAVVSEVSMENFRVD
jgi:hypothetical protein